MGKSQSERGAEVELLTAELASALEAEMRAVIEARARRYELDTREADLLVGGDVPGKNERSRDAHIQQTLEEERSAAFTAENARIVCQFNRQIAEQKLRSARQLFNVEANAQWQQDPEG